MNNLYRFLRYAMLLAVMMPLMVWGQITPTTDSNGNGTIEDNEKNLYLIQTNQFESFYITPKSNNLNTVNLPHASMLWYFLEAEDDNGTQYYYIVNNSTGKYICNTDYADKGRTIALSDFDENSTDKFKFKLVENNPAGATGYYNIDIKPNESEWLGLNKQSGNVAHSNGIRLTNDEYISQINSRWKFIPYNGTLVWPNPTFTVSTDSEKNYFKIRNKKDNTYYISTNPSTSKVTYSSTANNKTAWYFKEAPSSGLMKYYYIINPAADDKYMYYDGTATNGKDQSDAVSIKDINDANADADRFLFVIVQAAVVGNNDTPINGYYMIVPKLLIGNLWSSNSLGNSSPSNNANMGIIAGRGADVYSHWSFEPTAYVAIEDPTVTNNFDGTISLSTNTTGATIYYTTNGTTPSSSNGTLYASAFSLNNATVIKAIAYLGSDFSDVTTYDVPKYSTPTISFDDITSEVTITSEGTVYYNTGDGSQDDPTPSSGTLYSAPFELSSATTVKAIATHAGYLTSDVATWSANQVHDYSQDYLTFRILTAGTICWKAFGSTFKTIEYSKNGGEWTSITPTEEGATFSVETDDVVRFRGNNTQYATSKSNYSGFEGGTATFDIEGNIHSLLYGDNFANNNALTNSTYQFCSLFKKAHVISAENLILPATTLKNYCYRALFSWCTTLTTPPALPATTLAQGCYWYMFEQCALSSAPELPATTLVNECYGHMFEYCSNLKYIKCVATSGFGTSKCLENWVLGVSSIGTFVNEPILAWTLGASGIPSGWTYNAYLFSPEISCDGENITITCATEGADIYYRLNQTGNFSLYNSPIAVNSTTTVEAYSSKGDIISNTVIYTFEIFDNPFDESTRSIDSWTYDNTQVTLPYSVNGIDGHSSSYSKGTHTFETTITIYKLQPTYLWFQHADQSADIYVNNTFVTTHWGGYNAFFVCTLP